MFEIGGLVQRSIGTYSQTRCSNVNDSLWNAMLNIIEDSYKDNCPSCVLRQLRLPIKEEGIEGPSAQVGDFIAVHYKRSIATTHFFSLLCCGQNGRRLRRLTFAFGRRR
jgi:hypothetical protein